MTKHLLSIDDVSRDDIDSLLKLTDGSADLRTRRIPRSPALRGKTVAWLFYEDSTRTRLSFETAAKTLSADTLNFSVNSSSVNKGESLRDTVETIGAMGVDGIVVRHSCAGVPQRIANWIDAPSSNIAVINAGDGAHEHPTQALLDLYTATKHLGSLEGKHIAFVGDIRHSRVARSGAAAFAKMGAQVTLVAPQTLLPPSLEGWQAEATNDFDSVLAEVDICYLLRMQLERQNAALVPSLREYRAEYGLNQTRAKRLKDSALIMHPGPMNRDVEIAGDVADHPNAVITDQVSNGVALRMAVLFNLLAVTDDDDATSAAVTDDDDATSAAVADDGDATSDAVTDEMDPS